MGYEVNLCTEKTLYSECHRSAEEKKIMYLFNVCISEFQNQR